MDGPRDEHGGETTAECDRDRERAKCQKSLLICNGMERGGGRIGGNTESGFEVAECEPFHMNLSTRGVGPSLRLFSAPRAK